MIFRKHFQICASNSTIGFCVPIFVLSEGAYQQKWLLVQEARKLSLLHYFDWFWKLSSSRSLMLRACYECGLGRGCRRLRAKETGRGREAGSPQILADLLTLFQPGRGDRLYQSHNPPTPPHDFQTFLRPWEARQDQEAGITASYCYYYCTARPEH